MANFVFSVLFKIEKGDGCSVNSKGPVIILPKHQYWTDIPLVSLAFPFPLYFLAKVELFRSATVRWLLMLLGGIPLDRDQSVRTLSSFRSLLSLLREGEKVVLFPEGTYVRGIVGAGRTRLIQMILGFQPLLRQKVPFVPVGIRYGERAGWRRRVEIRVGQPLFGEKESEASSLTSRIMEEIATLSRLDRRQEDAES